MGASTRTCHGRYSPSFHLWFFLIHRIGPARKLQGQIAVMLQALSEVFAQRLRLLSFRWMPGGAGSFLSALQYVYPKHSVPLRSGTSNRVVVILNAVSGRDLVIAL